MTTYCCRITWGDTLWDPAGLGYTKPRRFSATLSEMIDDPTFSKPLVANVLRPGRKSSELASSYENSDFILDMAASVPVSRHLVNGVESNARRVSLFLNPAGSALTLLGEDEDRNIPLDMLEMQFYREIVANSRLKDLLRPSESNKDWLNLQGHFRGNFSRKPGDP